ncbi:unnamed protein product [Rotaria socialis]|uniref:Pectate lyase superfamily protein domain-containing protein n=2 Tax=Rotaria socialis TaxID=392032 RepID=A0A818R1A2_9BILA|nr:unnamed protein product [Rotaria socialis]
MKFNYRWLFLIISSMNYVSSEGHTFLVSDYGVYPNDDLDDTIGIQLAVNAAIKHGFASDIIFEYGIYTITSTILIMNATDLTIRGQGADQTYLIGYNQVSMFFTQYCQALTLTSFSIDYNPLPFTAGYVVNVDDKYLDIKVVPPHQADINRQVQAILRYDPIEMRPAFGPNTYEIYQIPPTDAKTTVVSPGVLRLPLRLPSKFLKGDPIVARYAFGGHAIYGQDVTDMTIQSITIYTSWGMGFVTLRARRLNIMNYQVLPQNGRWMSSIVDCMHFADTREYISISDSICEAMGDDGLNVHAVFFLVTEIISSNTIIIAATNWTDPLDFGVGTTLEFSYNQQPFTIHENGTVSSLIFNSTNSRKIIFTNSVSVNVGDWVCVANTPLLTIRNFTVANNRARGVLLETRNVDIRKSLFKRTSGPAVLIQPSIYWHEGPEARNISLSENIYIDNNEGIAQEKGIITILPDPLQLVPVINDIRIESSTFYFGIYSQALLQCDNTNLLLIRGNYIATNSSTPFISICNSRNISAENNCVVNSETKIDEYYSFDPTTPCSKNLSSLIDLPPSAFNSSFPPPVVLKDFFLLNRRYRLNKGQYFE